MQVFVLCTSTVQHNTVLMIFPVIIETIITAELSPECIMFSHYILSSV